MNRAYKRFVVIGDFVDDGVHIALQRKGAYVDFRH